MLKMLFVLLSGLIFVSCSGGANPDRELQQKAVESKQVVSGIAYDVLVKDTLTFDGRKVSGSGKILALTALKSAAGSSFKLSVNLQDNGELTLHSFSDNKLEKSFDVSIRREGAKVKFILISSGKSVDYSEIEGIAALNAIETINLTMDVHNSESPAHFILWNSSESTYDENTALLNTADEPKATPGKGSGQFFGLTLKNAEVLELTTSSPNVSH